MEWYDDPNDDYDPALYDEDDPLYANHPYQENFVSLFFLDVDKGVEVRGGRGRRSIRSLLRLSYGCSASGIICLCRNYKRS